MYAEGREVELTRVEFALLQALCRARGRILSFGRIMDCVFDDHRIVSDRSIDRHIDSHIDSHIKKLRRNRAR